MRAAHRYECACRLCSSPRCDVIAVESRDALTYHVVRCTDCRVIQTAEHYSAASPDYTCLRPADINENRIWLQGNHKVAAFEQWWALVRPRLRGTDKPSLLDIGCGTGGFLSFCRDRGFAPFGFDVSAAQAGYARRSFADVRCAETVGEYLRQLDTRGARFDVITMWDVLEHLRGPLEFLTEVGGALADDGFLFVSVPNAGAIPWKLRLLSVLRRQSSLAPWEHVFYFSPASLSKYLAALRFEVESVGPVVCYPRPLSAFEIARRLGFLCLSLFPSIAPQFYVLARRRAAPVALGWRPRRVQRLTEPAAW